MKKEIAKIQGSQKANNKTAQVEQDDNGQITVTWSDDNEVRFSSRAAYDAWTSYNPYIKSIQKQYTMKNSTQLSRFYVITVPHQREAELEEYADEQHFIDATADVASMDANSEWWEYVTNFTTAREYAVNDLNTIIIIANGHDLTTALQYKGHQDVRVHMLLNKIVEKES